MDLTQLSDEVEHVSQVYAAKFGIERDATWFLLKLQEEVGELTQAFLMTTGQARDKEQSPDELDEAFRREVADVFCQTLLLARFHDIDRTSAVNAKWLVWAERPNRVLKSSRVVTLSTLRRIRSARAFPGVTV